MLQTSAADKRGTMRNPTFSLEVFPPKRTAPIGTIYDTMDGLQGIKPDFISVTYGTGKSTDRTATARIANTIRAEYGIESVAHLTAQYLDRNGVDQALEMFKQAGVSAVLALRGDTIEGAQPANIFCHASDLVEYIAQSGTDFDIYAACYPEKHPQASSLDEDLDNLKKKVDCGVNRLISQLFYDNEDFFRFLDAARDKQIDVPIEAGIMPVTNVHSVKRMAKMCGARIPEKVRVLLDKWGSDPDSLKTAGVIYACEQISDLVANGVDGIHLYSMNHPGVTRRIWSNVYSLFAERL